MPADCLTVQLSSISGHGPKKVKAEGQRASNTSVRNPLTEVSNRAGRVLNAPLSSSASLSLSESGPGASVVPITSLQLVRYVRPHYWDMALVNPATEQHASIVQATENILYGIQPQEDMQAAQLVSRFNHYSTFWMSECKCLPACTMATCAIPAGAGRRAS